MLKAGIFLDMENLMRNGGWGLRYEVIRALAEAQGTTVVRANAYMAIDRTREDVDLPYREQKSAYRRAIRKNGFHLVLKDVKRYRSPDGDEVMKADADLDLAVEALLQAENLDYVLLGTGDGDFLRLVRALQSRGRRVDLLAFGHTSRELMQEVDTYYSGFLIPGLLPGISDPKRQRGTLHHVNEERGFGFLTLRTGLGPNDLRDDIFCHVTQVTRDGAPIDNATFAHYKSRGTILEFEIGPGAKGPEATRVVEFRWERLPAREPSPET